MAENFQDRMFRGAEAVREAYERGEIQGGDAVEAALMDAQADASQED